MGTIGENVNLDIMQRGEWWCPVLPSKEKRGRSGSKRLKIALYSHDTMGLGHIRRNLLIAQALSSCLDNPAILLISGALEAGSFTLPEGTDCLTLPSLLKNRNGDYSSRRLGTSIETLKRLREKAICGSIAAFSPDILIVDNVARGALGELDETLEYLRIEGKTKTVFGIRDIRDEASTVQLEWERDRSEEIISRYYDEIWVYGDKAVYDPVVEYGFSREIAGKIRYTGYFDQKVRLNFTNSKDWDTSFLNLPSPAHPFILCTVGGGQDGELLSHSFLNAEFPGNTIGVLIAGPHMAPEKREHLKSLARSNSRVRVIDFLPEPAVLMEQAECVISMGGYNSVSEAISFGKQTLIVPRIHPRKEQLIRAQRLRELNIIDMLHPENLNSRTLSEWMKRNTGRTPEKTAGKVRMNGLTRISQMVYSLGVGKRAEARVEKSVRVMEAIA